MPAPVPVIYFEDLSVGMTESIAKTFDVYAVQDFADLFGDHNPVHVNSDYARGTKFGGLIAHGMMTASLSVTILGMKLPGHGAILLRTSFEFKKPVHVGSTVTVWVTIKKLEGKGGHGIVTLTLTALNEKDTVMTGEATVMVKCRKAA